MTRAAVVFNLRDYFSSSSRATAAYKPCRLAIEAHTLGAAIAYTSDAANSLDNYTDLIWLEHVSSARATGCSLGILTPSIGLILEGAKNFSHLDLSGKTLWHHGCPDTSVLADCIDSFWTAIEGRLLDGTDAANLKANLELIKQSKPSEQAQEAKLQAQACIISDSHGYLLWQPGTTLLDVPGRTLWNFINSEASCEHQEFTHITLCFGEIDNRHHWAGRAHAEIAELAARYVDTATSRYPNASLTFATLLPQLPDSAHIKKAYWHKSLKFAEPYAQREAKRQVFNAALAEAAPALHHWSSSMDTIPGKSTRGIRDIHFRGTYALSKLREQAQ